MFFATLFIAIGAIILLSTMGIINGTFWGFFWAFFFIIIGLKMMVKKGSCPICGQQSWGLKMHSKIHEKMDGACDCGQDHKE